MSVHLADRLTASFNAACGDTILRAMCDPSVIEIMINEDGSLWIENHEEKVRAAETIDANRRKTIVVLCADKEEAGHSWELQADLRETGHRFHAVMPPAVSSPVITIRKHAPKIIPLEDWISSGRVSERHANLLRSAIEKDIGIVFAGIPQSGKTTLLNSLGQHINPRERVITLEDTREISLPGIPDRVHLVGGRNGISMAALARTTLRMRPDRIVIGEARDGATLLEALKISETVHGGLLLTVHAESSERALRRLERLLMEVSQTPLPDLIADCVGLVVFLRARRVREILRVRGYECGRYIARRW